MSESLNELPVMSCDCEVFCSGRLKHSCPCQCMILVDIPFHGCAMFVYFKSCKFKVNTTEYVNANLHILFHGSE